MSVAQVQFTLICILLGLSVQVGAAPAVALRKVEPFFEDDIATIQPPANSMGLQSFVIPSFRGQWRIGAPNEYGTTRRKRDPDVYANITQRNEGLARKFHGNAIYHALLGFAEHKNETSIATLREAMSGGSNPANAVYVNHDRDWSVHLHYLGISLTDDAGYRRFFCAEGQPCALETLPNPRAPMTAMQVPFWGGGKNEFRGRESYRSFVDTYATQLFDWGASLSRDVYMVTLIDYNNARYSFERAGYVINFSTPRKFSASQSRAEIRTAKSVVTFSPSTAGYETSAANIEVFLPMDADAGNSFYKTYQERTRANKPLYAVYAARLTKIVRGKGQNYPASPMHFDLEHVITGDAIELIYGEDLKEVALTVALR